jgi:hypothetical protein
MTEVSAEFCRDPHRRLVKSDLREVFLSPAVERATIFLISSYLGDLGSRSFPTE